MKQKLKKQLELVQNHVKEVPPEPDPRGSADVFGPADRFKEEEEGRGSKTLDLMSQKLNPLTRVDPTKP